MLVAFDMFGTLADTAGVISELAPVCGDRASQVALAWRGKQLEYMFRVTAMGQFPPFGELTQWGLAAALAESGFSLPGSQLRTLASAYQRLRPFDDARPALAGLHQSGHTIAVFSVGPRSWLEELTSSYREFVDALVSAEDAGVYKPHPGIYQYLLATMKTGTPATLLVSSNPFDLIGASAAGLRTAWCKRQPSALFDPWGSPPDHVITGLDSLAGLLSPASC
jgi:2-haloacid dehalogenase